MAIKIIVAAADNNVIGVDGTLPWHISEDLKRFKRLTKGHTCLMGRKTFESLPVKPFKYRRNVVVSRSGFSFDHEDVEVFPSIQEALEACAGDQQVFICGGASIYEAALEFADEILITRVHDLIQGDTYFPDIPSDKWELTELEHHDYFTYLTYKRR